ncbi:hypothetical protein ATE48_05960 [Candidatus Viadribacter manganicus]|uniref:Uncharacterized protein n=2 Tax=Candidatus Viadribacter manganicus TaxID=1759059 RepID=A0A1B1AG14_9PROT|nr:hypothetical protein ATE48_05960 [Candidatus Viadribacter manganicus]
MDVNAHRTWGIAVTGVLMAGALMIAFQPETRAHAQPQAAAQIAQAQDLAAHVGFIVKFRGSGPIARAQALAARGELVRAQRQVEVQLTRQAWFAGLCFDRFTVGGAEIVLRTCQTVAVSERSAVQQSWGARLRAMRAVEYVDANATVTPQRAPG